MSIISTIALLCQVNAGSMSVTIEKIEAAQLTCQKYYVNCMVAPNEAELKRCIIEKK